jgi:hypothetical protein
MYAQKEKPAENKSRAVANSVAQKKSNGQQGVGFVDNRPESVVQKKLLTQIGGSSQPIQRAINSQSFLKTKNSQYLINPNEQKYLFSKMIAKAPMPTGLYHMATDHDSVTKEKFKVWIPNVRFTSQTERAFIAGANATGFLKFEKRGVFNNSQLDLNPKADVVANGPSVKGVIPATVGAFGKNDCNVFATKLQTMIAHEKDTTEGLGPIEPKKRIGDISTASKEDLDVGVGDKMVHMYPNTEACKYHAATIVAQDGGSSVTLEGHVSKNLERPQFHMRNGVAGFVKDNDTVMEKRLLGESRLKSRGLGNRVEIDPLNSIADPARDKQKAEQRYRIMKGTEPDFDVKGSGAVLGQDIGITDTNSEMLSYIALEIGEEIGRMYGGWSKKQIQEFALSSEGKQKARIRISNMKNPTPSYIS